MVVALVNAVGYATGHCVLKGKPDSIGPRVSVPSATMVGFFGDAPSLPRTAVIGGFAHPAYLSRRTCSVVAPVCRESGVVTTLQGVDSVPRVAATNQFGGP